MGTANGSTTKISWTNKTWNPTHGCSHVSDGCKHCYAEAMSNRFGRTSKPWVGAYAAENVTLKPERLDIPFRWKEPAMCFVDSMADLFHELVPFEYVARVWAVMALTPHITYQILTKRPERMAEFLAWPGLYHQVLKAAEPFRAKRPHLSYVPISDPARFPLPNVWLGTSVEDDRVANRIPALVASPAAVRFLSCEPLIGPLNLSDYLVCEHWQEDGAGGDLWRCVTCGRLRRAVPNPAPGMGWLTMDVVIEPGHLVDWVILGGESGAGARPMDLEWMAGIVYDCRSAGVPVFVKQMGTVYAKANGMSDFKGESLDEFPAGLRIREFPVSAGRG